MKMDWNKLLSAERLRNESSQPQPDTDKRNVFESDLGRIIFSPAVRRMHDKTQVFPLISDDNIHTRLTHSMEVMSVAQSMGVNVCSRKEFQAATGKTESQVLREVPIILSCTGLCHDIGNPPFGHYGEDVISKFFKEYFEGNSSVELKDFEKKDFTSFNGNAQGFRVLTRLQVLQDTYGLNLSVATLSSFLKYPSLAKEIQPNDEDYRGKLGVFNSEADFLQKIRTSTSLDRTRHPLAFLMEAADSICYLTMDTEDGFNKGNYGIEDIIEFLKSRGNDDVNAFLRKFHKDVIEKVEPTPNRDRTIAVRLRVAMIRELVRLACDQFITNLDAILSGGHTIELIRMEQGNLANVLQDFGIEKVYRAKEVHSLEVTGESVIVGLLRHFVDPLLRCKVKKGDKYFPKGDRLYTLISSSLKALAILETKQKEDEWYKMSDYSKLRLIVDFLSGMTDSFALNLYQKLEGIKIG